MGKPAEDTFWTSAKPGAPVERRIAWKFGGRIGELTLSIAADSPVPDFGAMSEKMIEAATVPTDLLRPGHVLTPQLVFAHVVVSADGSHPVVIASGGRELPIIQVGHPRHSQEEHSKLSIAQHLERTKVALPAAQVAAGDHAVGWLAKEKVLEFYPLVAVSIPEEIESFQEGSASTSDVLPMIPFQA